MATQFGYLVLFGVIWPLSPIWSLVNNFVRLVCSIHYVSSLIPVHAVRDPVGRIQDCDAGSQAHPKPRGEHRALA